ncbi:MAG: NADH:flavin oxidoreductase [Pseudomonadota bacterium]
MMPGGSQNRSEQPEGIGSSRRSAAGADPLLSPLTIRGLTLRNRILSTAHACGLEEDGLPGTRYRAYQREKARGGLALTMFGGSSFVARDSRWPAAQLDMSDDRIIPDLTQLAADVHGEGAALMIQITHLGRRAETNTRDWLPTLAPSRVRETGHRSIPREMDEADIARVVHAFGDAAARAEAAGLDGLETMTAGHLIGQFFSSVTNQRTDRFGGSLENRCRFGLMVHEEIRRRVGDGFVVGMRLLIDEAMPAGLNASDCIAIAQTFERAGLVDFFNVNYGRLDNEITLATDCMPGMASPNAPWLARAGAFRAEVSRPVFHAAKINDLATARHAIREGLIDMVGMTRAHIADPHLVAKLEAGEEERIRPCVGASHCMSAARPTCLHNAATGREHLWPQRIVATNGARKKITIVGAGPAGLEAARIAAARGHHVTIVEASSKAGGQLALAAGASWRQDLRSTIDWRVDELARAGVTITFDCFADEAAVRASDPDVVIIATGGIPDTECVPGGEQLTSTWDVISGHVRPSGTTLVYDGTGRHGALTALDVCAQTAAAVRYVCLDDRPAAELGYAERVIWKRSLAERQIVPEVDRKLSEVRMTGNSLKAILVCELTGAESEVVADHIVADLGTAPVVELFDALRPHARNDGVLDLDAFVTGKVQRPTRDEGDFMLYRIGDAVASRDAASAFYDALRLCCVM